MYGTYIIIYSIRNGSVKGRETQTFQKKKISKLVKYYLAYNKKKEKENHKLGIIIFAFAI